METENGVVRVRRDALTARLTCPLCQDLFREASAFVECLHTFCRECIMKKIDDEEIASCPVCHIDLGIAPEEKLRPDHNIQSIRNKVFPRKTEVDASKVPNITSPAKRKERSLSSLVVETPKIATQTSLTGHRTKRIRKEPQAPSSNQEVSNTDDTSSGGVEEVQMPSANLDPVIPKDAVDKVANLAKPPAETQEPITSSSAVPLLSGEGCDLSGLLTFYPESIEPAPSTACDEPRPSAVLRQFQRLKALLSSPIETLVEDPEEVKSVLEEIQHHLPVTFQVKLWPVVTLSVYGSRVNLARHRIDLRHAQLPLKADIADKCQRLNEKKAALDAKTDTSVSTAELETLRKELEDLEERVRATKQLIYDKEALIARSQEEAEGLKAQLKTDLTEIRALNKRLVTGEDEDDEAEIAEVDRVRADALRAFEAFLQ